MKVLLVENDEFFQKMYSTKLKKEGFEVFTAINGEEALAKMEEVHPAIVLLDLVMPIKDGFEVLQARSQNEDLKKIPMIVFSTLEQPEDIAKAKELGAVDYVDKNSANFQELLRKIRLHTGTV